jgi:hypothetical protein
MQDSYFIKEMDLPLSPTIISSSYFVFLEEEIVGD